MGDKGKESRLDWATAICEASASTCPAELLEKLMAAPQCDAFGPVHHYLAGASLLACANVARGSGDLSRQLEELSARSSAVPGGSCARWGICGAAASCGMALAIVLENAPLKREGWSEGQEMVADLLGRIARSGAPRCCKRDSRIAVRGATPWFNRILDIDLELPSDDPRCRVSAKNAVCLGGSCPYFD